LQSSLQLYFDETLCDRNVAQSLQK